MKEKLKKEENDDKRNDLDREKENLEELKNFLAKEIEDLKTEISLFKRKGFVYFLLEMSEILIKVDTFIQW